MKPGKLTEGDVDALHTTHTGRVVPRSEITRRTMAKVQSNAAKMEEKAIEIARRKGIPERPITERRVDPAALRVRAEQAECARCGCAFLVGEARHYDDAYFTDAQVHSADGACEAAKWRAKRNAEIEAQRPKEVEVPANPAMVRRGAYTRRRIWEVVKGADEPQSARDIDDALGIAGGAGWARRMAKEGELVEAGKRRGASGHSSMTYTAGTEPQKPEGPPPRPQAPRPKAKPRKAVSEPEVAAEAPPPSGTNTGTALAPAGTVDDVPVPPSLDGDTSMEAFRKAYLQLLLARAAHAAADDPILDRIERLTGVAP